MTAGSRRGYIGVHCLVGFLLGIAIGYAILQSQVEVRRASASALGYGRAQLLNQRLNEALGPAYMLASLVQQGSGKMEQFEAVAAELMQQFPMARALELAPGGVVTQVFPLPGNELIVGHDLLKDRERNREAFLAVSTKQLTLAGPFDLLQGGLGAVGRYPVFRFHADGRQEFWGFTIVLIRVPELLGAAGFLRFASEDLGYEICLVRPEEGDCKPFYHQGSDTLVDPVVIEVNVPNSKWHLSLAPEHGWISIVDWLLVFLAGFGVAVLLGGLQWIMLNRVPEDEFFRRGP